MRGTQIFCVPYFLQQDIIMIALDIETYDPNLKELGDGSIRKDGKILCCGSYNGKKAEAYIPDTPGWQKLIDILKSDEPKIFHNGIYDLAWLCCGYNLKVNGTIHDTMTRMSMINEYADLDLDTCCKQFNIKGKNKNETIEAWYDEHKKALNLKGTLWQNSKYLWDNYQEFRDNMIKYNLQDCIATYNLFFAQEPRMQNYQEAYQMECDLYPLLIEMKKNGVRIDEKRLAELTCQIKDELASVEQKLKFEWGLTPAIISSTKQLGTALTKMGLHSPMKTPKGAESWAAEALDRLQEYEVVREIQHWKTLSAVIDKYLQGALYKSIWNGRIHCTFSPNKRDDGGTITGRFACLATGTSVYTIEYGYIPIEDIKPGLHTITHTGKIATIKKLMCNGIKPVYLYDNLICTDDHLIWTGTQFKEAKYVNFKTIPQEHKLMPESSCCLSSKRQTNNERIEPTVQYYRSQYSRSYQNALTKKHKEIRAWAKSEQGTMFRDKCNAWENWSKASWLQRYYIRWTRQPNDKSKWTLRSLLQKSNGRCYWNRCRLTSFIFGSASHRWEQNEQQLRQSLSLLEQSPWHVAQEKAAKTKRLYMGNVLVWDIEVDHEDHSFLANGYYVHNCKNPNLQNIPARETKHGHKSYGPEMRELFIPENDCWMFACDYSQIEYLLLAHFAVGPQAEWFREQANAGVDFHTTVQQSMSFPERGVVKALNYGKMYGMGINKMMQLNYVMFSKLAADRGMDLLQFCTWINDLYNEKMPVIKDTMLYIQNLAKVQGYVESIGGRYHHKPRPYFDPTTGKWNDGIYKMTNYLIQGSAADILKKGLLDAWNSGVFNTLKMHITVHDENVCSVPKTKEGVEAAAELEACMNNAYKDRLLVPMKAVGGIGDNWNGKHAEDDWQKLREKYGLGRSGEHNATARIIK